MKNSLPHFKQSVAQWGVNAAGFVATFGLAAALVAAWIVTAPLFFITDRLAESGRELRHKKFVKGGL